MSLSGNLNEFSVLETLQLIGLQKKTGVLEVTSSRRQRTLQFQEGRLLGCYADRAEDPDPLLEGLAAIGVCEIRQARSWRGAGVQYDLEALRGHCGLEAEEFYAVRRLLLQGTIDQILLWDQGQFCFTPALPPLPNPSPLNLEEILLESMRRLDEAVELRNGGLPPQAVPHAVDGPRRMEEAEVEEPHLRWVVEAVFRRCDGRQTLKRIGAELGLAEYDLLSAVATLRRLGRVRVVTRGRGEGALEPLLEQPRRLPNPAAPLYAALLLLSSLALGWSAHQVSRGVTGFENGRALQARGRFETERSLRHMLELHRLREGRYPEAMPALIPAGLWPAEGKREFERWEYAALDDGTDYTLAFQASEESQSGTTSARRSQTGGR